jgi:energy-coupling factor transport system ATP-binding protein
MPNELAALDDVSFEIFDNEIVAIIGHTGSGKSTLIQHLNGLLKPDSGEILIGGTDITKPKVVMKDIRQKVGLVFQYPESQLFEETVGKDVAFGPKNLGLGEDEIDIRVRDAIRLVGLDYDEIIDRSPFDLSGGQKRKAAIAGVIAMKPQVLILDEPTAGLDPGAHREIIDMILDIHRKENNIIIFVTHDMSDVVEISDKVLVMDRGKLVMSGTPQEVFEQRRHLAAVGLDVPPVMELMYKLRDKGARVKSTVFSLDEAEEEIVNFIDLNKRSE